MTNKDAIQYLQFLRQSVEDGSPFDIAIDTAITALDAHPVWIPCSERMPQNGSAIIVYCADHDKNTGIVENCIIPKDFEYLRKVLRENGVFSNSLYWMPLPEPPEVKQNE